MTRCILPAQLETITKTRTNARVQPKPTKAAASRSGEEADASARPSVSMQSYYSRQDLRRQWQELDASASCRSGAVLVLHAHFGGSLQPLLARSGNGGGRLAIVAPANYSRTCRRDVVDSLAGSIEGWDEVTVHETAAEAMATMFHPLRTLDACRIFRPEWEDPSEIFQEVGRQLTAA